MIISTKPTRLLAGAHTVKTLTKEYVPPLFEWSRAPWFVIHSTCRNYVVLFGVRLFGRKCDVGAG